MLKFSQRFKIFKSQGGFTIMEVLMVVTIIGVLTVVSLGPIGDSIDQSRFDATVAEMKMIRDAILGDTSVTHRGQRTQFGFLGDIGAIPTAAQGIAALTTNPGLVAWTLDQTVRFGRGWNGPYLTSSNAGANFGLDGWGRAYIYNPAASPPNITSYGADGVAGGTGLNTDIVVNLPVSLQTANVYGFVSNNSDPYIGPADIEINYPDGTGALKTTLVSILAAAKGAFNFAGIPFGKRSISVYIPNKGAPTTTVGPTLITIDSPNYTVRYSSVDIGGGAGGGGPGCATPYGAMQFVAGTMSLNAGSSRLNFSANVTANLNISHVGITNSRVATWSTFSSAGLKSNCNGTGSASVISPCPVADDSTLATIAPVLAFSTGNNQSFKIDFSTSMSGAGTVTIKVVHNLGCEYLTIPGL